LSSHVKAHQASRELDDGGRGSSAGPDRERRALGHIGVAPSIGEADPEGTDEQGVGLGKDGATLMEQRGQFLLVEPVEVDRPESFLLHGRNVAVTVAWVPGRRDHRPGCLSGGRVERCGDVVDRRLLGLAHVLTVLPVGGGHVLGQGDDEPSVFVDLLRRRLALQEGDGVTQVL
jgi:hypothetical protein